MVVLNLHICVPRTKWRENISTMENIDIHIRERGLIFFSPIRRRHRDFDSLLRSRSTCNLQGRNVLIIYATRLLLNATVIMFAGFCYGGKSVEGPRRIIAGQLSSRRFEEENGEERSRGKERKEGEEERGGGGGSEKPRPGRRVRTN